MMKSVTKEKVFHVLKLVLLSVTVTLVLLSLLGTVAHAIKMLYKKSSISEEIQDYTVYPLEGIWKRIEDSELIKENLEYTIMIRQPDFISEEMVNIALGQVKKKKPSPFYDEMLFKSMQDVSIF